MFDAFKQYLQAQQIEPVLDNTSMIAFKYEELLFAFVSEKQEDGTYVRIVIPNFTSTSGWNPACIHESISWINTNLKVIKAIIVETSVWLSAEQFVFSNEKVDKLFSVMILALVNASKQLKQRLTATVKDGDETRE